MGSLSNKKSLLVVTSTFPRWENDTDPPFVMELCKRLVKKNIRIDVLAPHAPGTKTKEIMDGINVYRYKYFFSKWESLAYEGGILTKLKKNRLLYFLVPLFLLSQIKSIFKLIKNNQYDLIHAHWLIPQGFLSIFVAKYLYKESPKILCTSHGSDLFSFQSTFFKNILKWILNSADGVTVVSEHMRKACFTIINNDKNIHVCPMGVDLRKTFITVDTVKRTHNRIIFVGRLIESKGVLYLLDAIQHISSEMSDIELLIVGDGPEKISLEMRCKKLAIEKHVTFYGSVSQGKLPELYSSAQIAVMPSIKEEGLGLVSIEAMGCGCAVIMSSLNSAKEFIVNGNNGVLVKPADSQDLARAIKSLLLNRDEREQMAMNGRQSVIEKFDWERVVSKYEKIIESLCV